jgi:uncharacterized protein (UPF0276 family)
MLVSSYPHSLPDSAGIGLRSQHLREIESRRLQHCWFEIHAENYMADGVGEQALARIRSNHQLSVHGVGLSIGSACGINKDHLARLVEVCRRFEPALVSEHLCWSIGDGIYLNDLLPVPHDEAALRIVGDNILRTQDALGRIILIENLASYVGFARSTMSEPEFLAALVKRTGCGLLLDINNVYVSACNMGFDASAYIDMLPAHAVGEVHLAGHATNETPDGLVLIDNHGSHVPQAVWSLYEHALRSMGRRPTLIEWDSDIPSLETLLDEARQADCLAAMTNPSRAELHSKEFSNCSGAPLAMPLVAQTEHRHMSNHTPHLGGGK